MLTRLKLKQGECALEELNQEIRSRRATQRSTMAQPEEGKRVSPKLFENKE